MKKTMITAALALLSAQAMAADNPDILVLSLQTKVAGEVVQTTDLYTNQLNPNVSSVSDQYRLVVNGQEVEVPEQVLADLNHTRREFSYNSMTDGIKEIQNQSMCMLGGDSTGYVLQTRYLTFENHQIAGDEMKPVYAEAGNCLFNEFYVPNKRNSELRAAKSLAVMKTLSQLYAQ